MSVKHCYKQVKSEPRLSPRQKQILRRLSKGETWKEVAGALGIATTTLASHTSRIFQRLGARNTAHAVWLWCSGKQGR